MKNVASNDFINSYFISFSLDISRNCKVPRNFESFEEYRNSEWFACASTFSKYCTDCLCQIHSMRKVLDYEVPCCHGKCKGKIY